MGIDPARLLNHRMFYANADEMLQKIEEVSGLPVFVEKSAFEEDVEPVNAPNDFEGWIIHVVDSETVQYLLDKNDLITVYKKQEADDESFYINPYLLEPHGNDYYMGRWFEIKYIADWIKENGIPSKEEYDILPNEILYHLQNRKKIYERYSKWGTTCMVTFCDDKHSKWLDYFTEDKWTMEQFIAWGKADFIFVQFKDLPIFEFPDDAKNGYFNVFILDEFEDLK